MMKATFSVRRFCCLLFAIALTAVLPGCGHAAETAADDTAAAVSVVPNPEPADSAGADSSEAGTPAAVPAADGFFLTAEYGRLYFAPIDGSAPRLMVDGNTTCMLRRDGWIYAAFEDGSVRRLSLDGSQVTELVPAGGHTYRHLLPFDGGIIGIYYSLQDGVSYELWRDGAQAYVALFKDDPTVITLCETGKYMYCYRTDRENGRRLAAYDFQSLELVWETPIDKSPEMIRDDSGILCFIPNSGELFRLDEEAHALAPVDLQIAKTDCELLVSHGGVCLVQGNYSDDFRNYLVSRNGRRELSGDNLPSYISVMDVLDGKALLYNRSGGESAAGEDLWYTLDCYHVLDLESGEMSEFPVRGQYSRLFADGDFPVVDSSTARRPVTAEIYAFFCESTGAGGALPLCSTTHGAWLNIADGGADLALLAAPTQEEQAYLDERGVSVEMKLYGGDGLVFIGNHACGVEDMSLEQVRGIYRGEITNWAQLGGADHAIRVLYRDDQSGSQRLFERMLWKDESVPDFERLGFERLGDMTTIVSECLHDPYAIGYSIMTYLRDVYSKEELLAFSLEGYPATPENVASHHYPLGTQGYVVIRSDEPENSPARRLYDWFGSPLSDVILTNNGVTPLHDNG